MEVTINGNKCDVPFDLELISLDRFIDYQIQYGNDLDKAFNDLIKKEYEGSEDDQEFERMFDLELYVDNEALAWFSFWTNTDLFTARDHKNIVPVLVKYRALRSLLKEGTDKAKEDFPMHFNWKGEEWEIEDFKLNPASDMTFNEIVTSKETMRQLHSLEKGKWESLPYLAAIYFRKKGEAFEDEMIFEGSERMKLMMSLPLSIALKVSFFLITCLGTWQRILAYSGTQEVPINQN